MEKFLEDEITKRGAFSKKYFRIARITSSVDNVLITITLGAGVIVVKKTTIKAEKHSKIKMLASAKLDTIASHISKALIDNYVSDDEFKLIMEGLNKYKAMKEEIRSNTKKKIKEEEEASLIERGRQEVFS